jgi:magnesium-transporting ATPase (P-type)
VTAEKADWHALASEAVLQRLESDAQGLPSEEAARRLRQFGPNCLPEVGQRGSLIRFLSQFNNVLIYVLIGAGVVTLLLQHLLDAAVIFGVVLVNALIGFVQEGKAEDALAAIRGMLSPQARVLRDGRSTTVDAAALVQGDVVLLKAGDKVPADLRLLSIKGMEIEEAALTGESVPVAKNTELLALDKPLADRDCMAYSGTLVTHGQGSGVVVATGDATEIGRISAMVAGVEQLATPLLRQMAQFGHWLTVAILILAGISFAFGLLVRGYSAEDMFLASVGLAVAAIPEGLPAIMTITLAIGVQRMAKRNAIIRRLPAVETLGTVGVICSDKTGTLTRNQMTVSSAAIASRMFGFSGTGYAPEGEVLHEGEPVIGEPDPLLLQLLEGGMLCNDASLEQREGQWQVQGGPTEGALLVAAMKAGLDAPEVSARSPRKDLVPFDSAHKYMATLHHAESAMPAGDDSAEGESGGAAADDSPNKATIYLKGAPELVFARCGHVRTVEGDIPFDEAEWQQLVDTMAGAGQRVLALACKSGDAQQRAVDHGHVAEGMTLLGLFGLIDPPREEAIRAVAVCQEAGIRVKMITGDHAMTARAIAARIGLCNTEEALSGRELDAMDDAELLARVSEVDVYARVTPEHKLRLVTVLQQIGNVVAMTGDGVNDAPALKRADVGVAMGINGTEAAKEASEMVLADDNFASIANAVEEGRTVYDNLRKAILFILPTNGGEALVVLGAIVLGFAQFPLTPVQILWVNMVTAVTLALALAFEPAEPGLMRRAPRDASTAVLSGDMLLRIAYVSVILMLGTFGMFLWSQARGDSIEYARTLAVNTLVLFEMFYLLNSRYVEAPVLNREGLLGNRYVLLAIGLLLLFQLAFTYWGPLQTLFGTQSLRVDDWLLMLPVTASVLLLVELEKTLMRRRRERS